MFSSLEISISTITGEIIKPRRLELMASYNMASISLTLVIEHNSIQQKYPQNKECVRKL